MQQTTSFGQEVTPRPYPTYSPTVSQKVDPYSFGSTPAHVTPQLYPTANKKDEWDEDNLIKPYGFGSITVPYSSLTLKDGSKLDGNNSIYYLKENFLIRLNNSKTLRCFATTGGYITIFNLSQDDVIMLNSLLYTLGMQANNKTWPRYYIEENSQFFKMDNGTRIYNKNSESIGRELLTNAFEGKVCLKVMGFYETKQASEIALLAHIHQLKVEEQCQDDMYDTGCIF